MLGTDFAGRGFVFSIRFQDMFGKQKEIVEKKEYEARKLLRILNRKNTAELFIHYSNGYSKKVT